MAAKENKEVGNREKTKYLGRHIMIKRKFIEKMLSGEKISTIRLGRVKPKYKEMIVHGGGRPVAKILITSITYKKVKELNDCDARKDGFKDKKELLNELKKVYGEISPEDTVTIIEFKVLQRFDELKSEDPYFGLKPVDIARLGLRYLKDLLSEEDIKILESLTRTKSIRKTALKLYGSPEKRGAIRRVLRKALRLLRAKGLIHVSDI